MDLSVDRHEAETVVVVTGDVDADSAYLLPEAVVAAAEAQGGGVVVVDLSGVPFMDSVGLGMLLRCREELPRHLDARLRLRAPSERVRRLLAVTALDQAFTIDA